MAESDSKSPLNTLNIYILLYSISHNIVIVRGVNYNISAMFYVSFTAKLADILPHMLSLCTLLLVLLCYCMGEEKQICTFC